MYGRIIYTICIFTALFFLPWWGVVVGACFGALFFKYYFEVVGLFFLYESVLVSKQDHFLYATMITLICIFFIEIIRPHLLSR